jgi:protease-4
VEFKQSGKPLNSYIEQAGNLEYFLASAADTVYLHPQSVLDLRGLQAEVTFMRSTLDKLGIEADFEQIGPYKNAPDVYTRKSLSEAHREALEGIVDDLYNRLVDSLAEARGLSGDRLRQIIDQGPLTARMAHELGLVDGLRYRDEIEEELKQGDGEFRSVNVAGYQRGAAAGFSLDGSARVALIYGVGMIVGGESSEDALFGRIMGSDTIAQAFKEARKDDSIQAVVFRINSPGGSDVASDVIWREAFLTMAEKPVIVSMSDVAASGGYWIATASHAIVAEPTTLTGSIGIYAGKFNLSGLYEKIGFNKERVKRGESADFWSDTRSFSDEERARFREILEEGYRHFLEKVSQSRNKEQDEVDALGQGRVWTGAQALEHGLVDELGGLDRAVALAREKANIPESKEIRLEVYPHKKSYFEVILRRMVHQTPEIFGLETLTPERILQRSPVLRMLIEGQRLAIMPFSVKMH